MDYRNISCITNILPTMHLYDASDFNNNFSKLCVYDRIFINSSLYIKRRKS